jgi:hypothetical protein
MTEVIDIVIKKIPEGVFRKYTKEQMAVTLLLKHPELVEEVFQKSYFLDDDKEAANFLADCFIDEVLDIDTLESDEERKKRVPPPRSETDRGLWDMISEKV